MQYAGGVLVPPPGPAQRGGCVSAEGTERRRQRPFVERRWRGGGGGGGDGDGSALGLESYTTSLTFSDAAASWAMTTRTSRQASRSTRSAAAAALLAQLLALDCDWARLNDEWKEEATEEADEVSG